MESIRCSNVAPAGQCRERKKHNAARSHSCCDLYSRGFADVVCANSSENSRNLAAELLALDPDVVLAARSPATAALRQGQRRL